jgi:hydrogenase expression/formation protein HypE
MFVDDMHPPLRVSEGLGAVPQPAVPDHLRGAAAVDQPALPAGKLPMDLLARLFSDLRPFSPEVLVGPAVGEDACAIDLPAGVLVVSTDPITLTGQDIGRYAVTVNANDIAVRGVRPRWFLAAVLLPPGTTGTEVEALFASIRSGLVDGGIALVGGHTEITPAVNRPVVVGQMLGLAEDRHFVTTGGAQSGDVVFQVGAGPVEGAAVLAAEAGALLGGVRRDLLSAAESALESPGISVVDAALLGARLGSTAMHDPTEGGLAAGLNELAYASGVRLRVDRDRLLWWEPAIAVCRAVGADPWATLGSGTLLAAFHPAVAGVAAEAFSHGGHEAAVIAVAEEGNGVIDGDGAEIGWPEHDELNRILANLA